METLELPVAEELDESPAVNFAEQEMDIRAFELWQQASCLDSVAAEETGDTRETG